MVWKKAINTLSYFALALVIIYQCNLGLKHKESDFRTTDLININKSLGLRVDSLTSANKVIDDSLFLYKLKLNLSQSKVDTLVITKEIIIENRDEAIRYIDTLNSDDLYRVFSKLEFKSR
jgi:hypothetical protein